MSDLVNLYCTGYIATPILAACHKYGLFRRLDRVKYRSGKRLINELGANPGYFQFALDTLASLSWIEKNDQGMYRKGNVSCVCEETPDVRALYAADLSDLVKSPGSAQWLKQLIEALFFSDELNCEVEGICLLQGALVVPVLHALSSAAWDGSRAGLYDCLDAELAREVEKLFLRLMWIDTDGSELNVTGHRHVHARALNDVVSAMRPLLENIDTLLFGDAAECMPAIQASERWHAALSLIPDDDEAAAGEGYTQVWIDDFAALLANLHDEHAPKAIVCRGALHEEDIARIDASAGQGATLPLLLAAESAMDFATDHLNARLQRYCVQRCALEEGGAGSCLSVARQWTDLSSRDPLLYLGYFDQPNIAPEQPLEHDRQLALLLDDQPAHYVNAAGEVISSLTVLRAWKAHLQGLADSAGESSLVFLQSHINTRQPAEFTSAFSDFYVNALHPLRQHYPISADAFLLMAANVGLFSPQPALRYPQQTAHQRVALHHFTARDFRVRHAEEDDIECLVALEELCWQHSRSSEEKLRMRIRDYPRGQLVLEKEGLVVGAVYSQRIRDVADIEGRNTDNIHELHDASGAVAQLLAINIDPAYQHFAYGDALLEFALQYASVTAGITRVVGVTLCKNFSEAQGLHFEDYIQCEGLAQDPVLAFHHSHGAEIIRAVPHYRPEDSLNQHYGVLVNYELSTRCAGDCVKKPHAHSQERVRSVPGAQHTVMHQWVEETLRSLLGEARSEAYAEDRPLMEMGLDSADLLKLHKHVQQHFAVKLPAGFFFEFNSAEKIIAALEERCVNAEQAESASASSEDEAPVRHSDSDVAIVGVACRLPGGIDSPQALWQQLLKGESVISRYPSERGAWPEDSEFPGLQYGGFVRDVAAFDAAFFRMSPREAAITDPQQRMLLELSWACLEDACVLPARLKGSDTGVFIGASNTDYSRLLQDAKGDIDPHHGVGSALALIANRISYFFDFAGPSLVLDTACSASLVALHNAVRSLTSGECGAALVGGVNLICHGDLSLAYARAGMLAPDGLCKVFDEGANGYVRAEGAVVMLLKPLADAEAAGDRIYGVIKGSAVNHGGLAGGLTVPNPAKQTALLQAAWKNAGIDTGQVTYIEAHGTGTSLGDPIEVQGILNADRARRADKKVLPCALGSVKSVLGHLEAAAGLTGLLKTLLCLQHRRLPGAANFQQRNPAIDLDGSRFYIAEKNQEWQAAGPRIAGVSSFGSGGANAHVVVQEYVNTEEDAKISGPALFVLSALNRQALRHYAGEVLLWLQQTPSSETFAAALYHWQCSRTAMRARLAILTDSAEDLREKLTQWLAQSASVAELWEGSAAPDCEAVAVDASLADVAAAWVKGADIPWAQRYPQRPLPCSLPTYAFAGERFWLDSGAAVDIPASVAERTPTALNPAASQINAQTLLFSEQWQVDENTAPAPTVAAAHCVVFADEAFVAARQGEHLTDAFAGATCVVPGESFQRCDDSHYRARLDSREDLQSVLRDIAAKPSIVPKQAAPLHLVYSWAAGRGEAGVLALFDLCQQLHALQLPLLQLTLIGHYCPEQSESCWDYAWIGFERSLPLHFPELRISLLLTDTPQDYRQWRDALSQVGVLRFYQGQRLRLQLSPAALAEPDMRFRHGGRYLISGGLGAIGFQVAQFLAARYQAELILLGRSESPAGLEEKLARLRNAGATSVNYYALDVADRDQLRALADKCNTAIHGIVHAAGVEDTRAFHQKSTDDIRRVLRAKTHGSAALDEVLAQPELDFICYFSSSAALLGDFGGCDYAIANRYLMAYGDYRRRRFPGHTVVINWPLWREGAMGPGTAEQVALYLKSSGQRALETAEALALWHHFVQCGCAQVAVFSGEARRVQQFLAAAVQRGESHVESAERAPARALAELSEAFPSGDLTARLRADIRRCLAQCLSMAEANIDDDTNLADYGCDSIRLGQLAKLLSQQFDCKFTPAVFFSCATVSQLTKYVHDNFAATLTEKYAANSSALAVRHNLPARPSLPMHDARREEVANDAHSEAIAVIGMAGRFPKAESVQQFWQLLVNAESAIEDIPASRWDWKRYFVAPRAKENRIATKRGGFIADIENFDPLLFEISPREAAAMDPAERLLLMTAYHAIEDAAYAPTALKGHKIGVFVGMEEGQYPALQHQPGITTSGAAMISSRLSYFLDFSGPAMAINTACSSSLVALHQAVLSLRAGECDAALVGGVSLSLSPKFFAMMSEAGMLASDGRCQSFGQGAEGIGVGEAAVVLMLKPLSRALADGDNIYGSIKASGMNFDGRTNGVTAPSGQRQAALIEQLYRQQRIDPADIAHIVTHGTGTRLGDPVEVNALIHAFRALDARPRHTPCALTSCKSNIGHTMAASGLVSVVALLKSLQYGVIPASLHCDKENDYIDWGSGFFAVNKTTRLWSRDAGKPLLGAVSAFGRSGTNAHVVIEEGLVDSAGEALPASEPEAPVAIVLSAKSPVQLKQQAENLLRFLSGQGQAQWTLTDLAYTLQVARDAHEERLGFVVASLTDLQTRLQAFLRDEAGECYRGQVQSGKRDMAIFNGDEDMQEAVAKWIARKKYTRLLELWVRGLDVQWRHCYGEVTPKRLRLPGYPFAKQRCWLDPEDIEDLEGLPDVPHLQADECWDGISYASRWEIFKPEAGNVPALKQVLIVVADELSEFADSLAERCRDHGALTLQRLDITADNDTLLRCLQTFTAIDSVFFIAMPQALDAATSAISHNHELQMLNLMQSLKREQRIADTVDAFILTVDNQPLAFSPAPTRASGVSGLAFALAQGSYQFAVRNIDLCAAEVADAKNHQALIDSVLQVPPTDRGDLIKIAGTKYYCNAFYPLQLPDTPAPIRHGGVYVIAGGSGTVGQIFTRHLLEHYAATVVWLGRSPRETKKIQQAMQRCAQSKDTPDNVHLDYVQVDVCDERALGDALGTIQQRHGPVHGALFASMVFAFNNTLDNCSAETFADIFDVKAAGSLAFYRAFADRDLDFLCYFSSGQAYAFSGAAQLTAYASGIACADALVRGLAAQSRFPVGIVNWGFWQSTVETIENEGQAAVTEHVAALGDAEGCAAFERFLAALQNKTLQQMLCMRASPQIAALMGQPADRVLSLLDNACATGCVKSATAQTVASVSPQPEELIATLRADTGRQRLQDAIAAAVYHRVHDLIAPLSLPCTLAECVGSADVAEKYRPWLEKTLRLLAASGWLVIEAECLVSARAPEDNAWWQHQDTLEQHPDHRAALQLARACLNSLTEILQGLRLATDVIFPKASMALVEGVYKDNTLSDTFNVLVANAVATYVDQRLQDDPNARITILEIGAGTGGTSSAVFTALRHHREAIAEYCYTDLSKAFFFHAEQQYLADNPYLRFERLDVEKPLSQQGIAVGTYDLVIATNVLHATKNIRRTLQHAKSALRQQGLFIINELSTLSLFHHLTFGLLDGWWLFDDAELRIDKCPLLSPEQWSRVLQSEGLSPVFPAPALHELGQQIILAESDGLIFHPRESASTADFNKTPASFSSSAFSSVKDVPIVNDSATLDLPEFVRRQVLACLCQTLHIEAHSVDKHRAFSEYGIDSILGVSFVEQVGQAIGVRLNTAIIFEYANVESLSQHLCRQYGERLEATLAKIHGSKKHGSKNHDARGSADTSAAGQVERTAQASVVPRSSRASAMQSNAVIGQGDNSSHQNLGGKDEIAVIGMSAQLPKAGDLATFWQNLVRGVDAVETLAPPYLDIERDYSAVKSEGKTRCKWGGIVAERACFDALFFHISPHEAEAMNPHQRLMMQESWKAIENAGYNPKALAGSRTGMFVGAEPTGYFGGSFTGYSDAIIASRLAYFLNFQGPALVVNTGCSSSAVALHLACESLRNGESDLALAGGVHAGMAAEVQIRLDEIDMLSPSGRCATFDAAADGTVISEGVGVVVLKRLRDAERDGDPIHGVICASGINQDGASNGITAPNGAAQEALIARVYEKFNIDPAAISYVEAHGTGTRLGDPVEANALIRAFRRFTDKQHYCVLGSAKSHIGHTAAAAGVAGLIKILLSMRHGQLPRMLHFDQLNPLIELQRSPFVIPQTTQAWTGDMDKPRMAALNSFGHSGTNAHLVLRDYPQVTSRHISTPVLVPLSARSEDSLRAMAAQLAEFIQEEGRELALCDIAYTLQVAREAMPKRAVWVVNSRTQLLAALRAYATGEASPRVPVDAGLQQIADAWLRGGEDRWHTLYEHGTLRPSDVKRVHLPAYAFAKTPYWRDDVSPAGGPVDKARVWHPLLQDNLSDFYQQRYRSEFSGEEFFLRDHRIRDQRVLPAVAYLEMARAALAQAGGDVAFEIRDVAWLRPFAVREDAAALELVLHADESGEKSHINFAIYSLVSGEEIRHCEGRAATLPAVAVDATHVTQATVAVEKVAIQNAWQNHRVLLPNTHGLLSKETRALPLAQMLRAWTPGPDAAALYARYRACGTEYGPAHRGVLALYQQGDEVLAHLRLPAEVATSTSDFILHPSVLDSALQAALLLLADDGEISPQPLLPFALDSLRVFAPCQADTYAWLRYTAGYSRDSRVSKIDIDLVDAEGELCVQLLGFSARALNGDEGAADAHYKTIIERLLRQEISVDEAVELG